MRGFQTGFLCLLVPLGASWFLVTPMRGLLWGSVTDPQLNPLKAAKFGEHLPRCQHPGPVLPQVSFA